jgi:steroid delta-isomerase-like uncharacterized protein
MEAALEAVKRHNEAFNAHDLEALKASKTAETEWVQPGGIHLRGPDQVAELQSILWEAIPDATVTPVNQVLAGSTVVTESYLTGKQTGIFRTPQSDIPASGNPIKLRFVTVQRVEDGKIAMEHLYFDQLEFLTQLGAFPPQS